MPHSPALKFDWTGLLLALLLTLFIALPLLVVATWAFTEIWRYPSVIPQQFGLRVSRQGLEGRVHIDQRHVRLVGIAHAHRQCGGGLAFLSDNP